MSKLPLPPPPSSSDNLANFLASVPDELRRNFSQSIDFIQALADEQNKNIAKRNRQLGLDRECWDALKRVDLQDRQSVLAYVFSRNSLITLMVWGKVRSARGLW